MIKEEYIKLKKILKKFKKPLNELCNNNLFLLLSFSFITLFSILYIDLAIRYVIRNYLSTFGFFKLAPFLFTISCALLFILIILFFNKKGKIILYNSFSVILLIFFIVQFFYYKMFKTIFSLDSLSLAEEGSQYFSQVLSEINIELIFSIALFIGCVILNNIILFKMKINRFKYKFIIIAIIIILLFRFCALKSLGTPLDKNDFWSSVNNPRNIYNSYSDLTRGLAVSGVTEYIIRYPYVQIKNKINEPSKIEQVKTIDKYVKANPYVHTNNEYTNIFKGKNVIYILLESIDDFSINKEAMPTLYNLQEEGLNFTNRYASGFGNGLTFNTEFAMLTGIYQSTTGNSSEKYMYNTYENTFPKIFKDSNYSSISIHYNNGNFYNRKTIHKSIGFTNHYHTLNENYEGNFHDDTTLINNDTTYRLIVPKKGKFANLVSTMSGHLPYNKGDGGCEYYLKRYPELYDKKDYEKSCLYAKSHETDEFIRLLIKKLKQESKLDDTVLVFVTDHNAYGYSKVNEVKDQSDSNLILKVPFIIWNNNIKAKEINTIMDTADILPTISNMFGVKYNPPFSAGTDVFSKEHEKFVYFQNQSWYDGNIYYKNDDTIKETNYIDQINTKINNKIKINNLFLDSNYYKTNND